MGGLLMETLNMNRNMREIVLPKSEQKSFCAMAFDGCHFHFMERNDRSIHRYNQRFEHVDVIKCNRPFEGICYDHIDGCFWGFEAKSEDTIFRLDRNFREMETIKLRNYSKQGRHMLGISHCCERNMLHISHQNSYFEVSKHGDHRPVLFKEPCIDIQNHVCIAPYHAIARREGRQQRVDFFDRQGRICRSLEIPCEHKIEDILHFPCHSHTDFDLMVLVTKPCRGQVILYFEMTGMCTHDCHGNICRRDCRKEEREERRGGRCHHLWELIESVAKVEYSIAHILGGEGEKLRKAVKMADSIDELLDINKSVNKALMNITQLEYNLQSTLQFAGDILDEKWDHCRRRRRSHHHHQEGCEPHHHHHQKGCEPHHHHHQKGCEPHHHHHQKGCEPHHHHHQKGC